MLDLFLTSVVFLVADKILIDVTLWYKQAPDENQNLLFFVFVLPVEIALSVFVVSGLVLIYGDHTNIF